MRAAVVKDGVVINVIKVDGLESYTPPEGYLISAENGAAEIGWEVKDGKAIEPEPKPDPVPVRVTRFQARRALKDAGLFDQVETAVQNADAFTQDAWAEAADFKRHSPTVQTIAGELGLSDEQLDDLFRAAAKIEA